MTTTSAHVVMANVVTKPKNGHGRLLGLLALGLVVTSAVAVLLLYERSHAPAPAFRTVKVTRADITERVTATGTLQPVITSPVGAQVSGIVWKLHADYNSPVTAEQLLVELSSSASTRHARRPAWIPSTPCASNDERPSLA